MFVDGVAESGNARNIIISKRADDPIYFIGRPVYGGAIAGVNM
jgi:hypothetical protein